METRKIAAILVGDVVGYSYVLKGAMRRRVERCSHFARHVRMGPNYPTPASFVGSGARGGCMTCVWRDLDRVETQAL
jgi:hypothetical protein